MQLSKLLKPTPSGGRDVPMADAIAAFEQWTGIDPRSDPSTGEARDAKLALLMRWTAQWLDECAIAGPKRARWRERLVLELDPASVAELSDPPSVRGRPTLPRTAGPIEELVSYVGGPSQAALAFLLFGLHTHPYFTTYHSWRSGRTDSSVLDLHRAVSDWIRKTLARRDNSVRRSTELVARS